MADENPTGKGAAEPPSPHADDLRDQAVVLVALLDNWPVLLAIADLNREFSDEPAAFRRSDRVRRAVDELVAAGLVLACEEVVVPSRAALRFEQLSDL
jgi:hypothetical protein